MRAAAGQLADIPRAIRLQMEAAHNAASRQSKVDALDADILLKAPLPPADARVSAALWPLHDLRSARLEASLLLPLGRLLWTTVGGASPSASS